MRTELKTKKSISFAFGFLIIFLWIGIVFGGEIRITSDTWNLICRKEVTKESKLGETPVPPFCDVCGTDSDVPRGLLTCEKDLQCDCPFEPSSGEE